MRHSRLLLCLTPLAAVAAAPATDLKLFANGFQPGMWRMTPLDADSRMRSASGQAQCMISPSQIIHTGHSTANGDCGETVVENSDSRATVTYVCKGRGYGRTSIRREGDSYIVDAQGIDGREPFQMRGQYSRVGSCPAGGR